MSAGVKVSIPLGRGCASPFTKYCVRHGPDRVEARASRFEWRLRRTCGPPTLNPCTRRKTSLRCEVSHSSSCSRVM